MKKKKEYWKFDVNGPTPTISPEDWLNMPKVFLWKYWGSAGHLHNLLDDYALEILRLRDQIDKGIDYR